MHTPVFANVLSINQRIEILLKYPPALGDNLRLQRVKHAGLRKLGQSSKFAPNLGILRRKIRCGDFGTVQDAIKKGAIEWRTSSRNSLKRRAAALTLKAVLVCKR
jgi:hypothetical protein